MTQPSLHLSWAELACKDGTPYPSAFIKDGRARQLAAVFESIRAVCGNLPLTVLSAYRTPAHNRTVGGARNSQHVQGRALDLRPPKGMKIGEFYSIIRGLADRPLSAIRGVGRYASFVHVDIRHVARLVVWDGGSAIKDSKVA